MKMKKFMKAGDTVVALGVIEITFEELVLSVAVKGFWDHS